MNEKLIAEILDKDNETKNKIFNALRKEIPIHPLEEEFHCSAEIILEAISRS